MIIDDEFINRYIDGELTQAETDLLRKELNDSEELRKRVAAFQGIDKELNRMKEYKVSLDFTSAVMSKIGYKFKAKKKDKVFILTLSSIFVIIALGIVGYLFAGILEGIKSAPQSATSFDNFINYFISLTERFKNIFSSANLSVIGSLFSFIILISAYFFFENHKHSKESLSNLNSH